MLLSLLLSLLALSLYPSYVFLPASKAAPCPESTEPFDSTVYGRLLSQGPSIPAAGYPGTVPAWLISQAQFYVKNQVFAFPRVKSAPGRFTRKADFHQFSIFMIFYKRAKTLLSPGQNSCESLGKVGEGHIKIPLNSIEFE